ncbi:hypothetical protein CA234_03040 [Sphingomonas sp. ABOLE]|uniref:hypothetical protein n=1 Tax=Sphingomonas sp. ABOLE TaxID=1985878 RepID=UPI001001A3AA|nr:hypothetical protein [Sphingomonas sp. ABOLE]RSV44405.1 hypothetical protein CA234_03040 [Sphingomonas sp. ABOLE]
MMIAELQAGYEGLKAAFEIAKGFQALKLDVAVKEAVINLMRELTTAQMALTSADQVHSADLRKIEELERKIAAYDRWEEEKANYELADAGQGSYAYRYKIEGEGAQPPHWICPHCYEQRTKSILKKETLPVGRAETLVCHPCGFDIITRGVRHEQAPRRVLSSGIKR